MIKWRFLDLGEAPPYEHLEQTIQLERAENRIPDTLLICSSPPLLWIGLDHDAEECFNIELAKKHNIPIIKSKILCGGAEYFDQPIFSVWVGKESPTVPSDTALTLFMQAYCKAMEHLRLTATHKKNDILINGKKIGGFCAKNTTL